MKLLSRALLFALLALPVLAQDKPIPVAEESHHHLVLENDYTRVFRVEVPPKQSTAVHQHDRDYVWVQIGQAKIRNERMGQAPAELKLDHEVTFVKGGFAHKVTNVKKSPFVNVTIEVKKPSTKVVCGTEWEIRKSYPCGVMIETGGSGETMDVRTDAVEANTYFTTGTELTVYDERDPRLLVALTGLTCQCGGGNVVHLLPGDVIWVPKGKRATVSKLSDDAPTYVTVSFK